MGNNISNQIFGAPQDIVTFRGLPPNTPRDTIEIPEIPKNRHCTDIVFTVAYIIFVIFLIGFESYVLINSNIHRFNGYDSCGNVCGIKNYKYSQWSCTGQDFTNKPLLEINATVMSLSTKKSIYHSVNRKCVAECNNGYERISSACYLREPKMDSVSSRFKQKLDDEVFSLKSFYKYLDENKWRIFFAFVCSLGVTIILFMIIALEPDYCLWIIIAGILLFSPFLIGLLIYAIANLKTDEDGIIEPEDSVVLFFAASIIFLIFAFNLIILCVICVMSAMRKKIKLFIQLLKETIHAAAALPSLIFVPIIISLVQLIMLGILIWTSFVIASGTVVKKENCIEYTISVVEIFTIILNIFVYIWTSEIVRAIGFSLIAGSGATWYWSKTKENLGYPLCKFTYIVLFFHFGSVALGSLLLLIIMRVIKLFSRTKQNDVTVLNTFSTCWIYIKIITHVLDSITYIVIVIHGTSYFKSAKRACQIMFTNILNIAAIISIGAVIDYLIFYFMFIFCILITGVIMQETDSTWFWVSYLIVLFLTFLVGITVSTTYESLFATILICYCEDSIISGGKAATPELQDFIQKANEVYK